MAVLERSELEASPLADLHAIANQIGLDGFRRLRKAELVDAILDDGTTSAPASAGAAGAGEDDEDERPRPRRRRASRSRRGAAGSKDDGDGDGAEDVGEDA